MVGKSKHRKRKAERFESILQLLRLLKMQKCSTSEKRDGNLPHFLSIASGHSTSSLVG
jgi:hypothetical protein